MTIARKRTATVIALSSCCIMVACSGFLIHGCTSRATSTGDASELAEAKLVEGMGDLNHPVTSERPEAQAFFNQGLAFYYAFNFREADLSFRKATALDPASPMAYWGQALTISPHYNEMSDIGADREKLGMELISTAQKLSSRASNIERAYIHALGLRFSQTMSGATLERSYASAMKEVAGLARDDPDAATLYAESLMDLHRYHLWTPDGEPSSDETTEARLLLESTLRRWPRHLGANHLYIHLMEGSHSPQSAIGSAKMVETLAPSAGHLIHMAAHIYMRIGDYESALRATRAAALADQSYERTGGASNFPYRIGYAAHNQLLETIAAGMLGDFETAQSVAAALSRDWQPMISEYPIARLYAATPSSVLLRFERWKELIASAPNGASDITDMTFFWHYALGCAFAESGRPSDAQAELQTMKNDANSASAGSAFGSLPVNWDATQQIAVLVVTARIEESRGETDLAIANWKSAISLQDGLAYHEPADWYYPIRESLGSLLLRHNRLASAEETFSDELKRDPGNPRATYGLWQALVRQGKTALGNQLAFRWSKTWQLAGLSTNSAAKRSQRQSSLQ